MLCGCSCTTSDVPAPSCIVNSVIKIDVCYFDENRDKKLKISELLQGFGTSFKNK